MHAAVVQHCATTDVAANMHTLAELSRAAADSGAELICWPEAFAYLGPHAGKKLILEGLPTGGPILTQCQTLAQSLGAQLLLGGFHERHDTDAERCYNTSVLLGRSGEILASYRKIHLFDVDMADGPQLMESKRTSAGTQAVVADSVVGRLGMTVCYDVRFPRLYQDLADAGAVVMTVPSAFTATTGALHWHALLRARAIETQSYVVAPAQHGRHSANRASFGHSLIVDPWGEVVAEIPRGDGWAAARIDLDAVTRVRREIPSLSNRRDYSKP